MSEDVAHVLIESILVSFLLYFLVLSWNTEETEGENVGSFYGWWNRRFVGGMEGEGESHFDWCIMAKQNKILTLQ